jgi:alpha-glucoside transport system permease protein
MDIFARLRRIGLPRLIVHASVLLITILWLVPTRGILVTSLRDKDQITVSGWWTAFSSSEQPEAIRLGAAADQSQDGSRYVIKGSVFGEGKGGIVASFGTRVQEPTAYEAGQAADAGDGETLLIEPDGSYELSKATAFDGTRGKRVYISVETPPVFTLDNYRTVLNSEGIGQAFVNSMTVAIPATIIPILIAAFAAYALSWMRFSGRN